MRMLEICGGCQVLLRAMPRPGRRTISRFDDWSGREDLNLRPPAPHAGALPGCATPRLSRELYIRATIRPQGPAAAEFPRAPDEAPRVQSASATKARSRQWASRDAQRREVHPIPFPIDAVRR